MHFSTSLRAAVTVGALMLAAACGGATESPAPAQQEPLFKPIELPPPATVADTPGVARYWGVLPCADCAGIRHELVLVQDPNTGEPQTYELVETYLGSMSTDGERAVTTKGTWSIAKGGANGAMTMVRLDGGGKPEFARSFERLGETELRLLDRSQNRIESALPYSLTRVTAAPVTRVREYGRADSMRFCERSSRRNSVSPRRSKLRANSGLPPPSSRTIVIAPFAPPFAIDHVPFVVTARSPSVLIEPR